MAKKKRKYTKRASGTDRKPNRFNEIQRILGAYAKEHNIKFGKGQFAKKAGIISKQVKGFDLKAIEQNIDILYKDYIGIEVKEFRSGADFAWWYFVEEIKYARYDDVKISFSFDDGIEKFELQTKEDIESALREKLGENFVENLQHKEIAKFEETKGVLKTCTEKIFGLKNPVPFVKEEE